MRYLLIDDMRDWGQGAIPVPAQGDDFDHARDFEEGIFLLSTGGPYDVLYLDHDLGLGIPGKETGYDIMCWLEAECQDPVKKQFFLPKKIVLVTSNPVGRQKMQMVIDRLYQE